MASYVPNLKLSSSLGSYTFLMAMQLRDTSEIQSIFQAQLNYYPFLFWKKKFHYYSIQETMWYGKKKSKKQWDFKSD